ncbi:MAG: hypothetical protein ACYDCC_00595 [Actinomycetota bacterium]
MLNFVIARSLTRSWWSALAALLTIALIGVPTAFTQTRTSHPLAPHKMRALPVAPIAARVPRPSPPKVSPVAGKGMWIYQFDKTWNGNPERIAFFANREHLNYIYVRVGSSVDKLKTLDQAASIIPYAHAYGIKVIAWYFPYFGHMADDIDRSLITICYSHNGNSFDGFAPDIEPAPGSSLNSKTVWEYSKAIRTRAPHMYLIAVPPRPTTDTIATFPYAAMMPWYDAVAPMVYWGAFPPDLSTAQAIAFLSKWGKPIAPIGQAYDMASEGGPAGHPSAQATWSFMQTSKQRNAIGISLWSWEDASSNEWSALRSFPW